MKSWLIALIIVAVLAAGLLVYNEIEYGGDKKIGPDTGVKFAPCFWVYKTNSNYYDYQMIEFLNESFNMPSDIPHGVRNLYKLNNDYVGYYYGCYFPKYAAFINASISEYKAAEASEKESTEKCWMLMDDYLKELISEKCNQTSFNKINIKELPSFISEKTETGSVESNDLLIRYVNNDGSADSCATTLSSEEKTEFNQNKKKTTDCITAIPHPAIFDNIINIDFIVNNIIDKDPFTEFYLCKIDSRNFTETEMKAQINSIISNNELSTKCQKKK